MPRIRTIKPELWQDEKLAVLDPLTRLVFLGLISMADDAGRLVDNVKSIDGFIFPETEDTARDAIGILARLSRVLRYTSPNGQKLIQIVNWDRHQKVDNPNKYVLPAPPIEAIADARDTQPSLDTRENVSTTSRNVRVTTNDQRPVPTTPTNDRGVSLTVIGRSTPARNLEAIQARLAGVLAGVQADSRRRVGVEEMRRVKAELVFAYWASKLDHPKALLDAERERRLVKRLEENGGDVNELLYVVDGALKDDWTMGRSARNTKKFDGIETIYQDRAHVEKFAGLCTAYKQGTPHPMAVKYLESASEVA